MQSEEYVAAALRVLADQDRQREAPDGVEARLRQAFRRKQARRKRKTVLLAALAAAAGVVIIFVARSHERPKPVAPAPVPEQLVAAVPAPSKIAAVPAPKPVRPVRRQPIEPPREIVTQFFPLLDVAPPFEGGELLRVVVPASTMRRVGLPVNEDRLAEPVYADVLVGQEGLARAIRFVSYR
jgi:hypothetical protein